MKEIYRLYKEFWRADFPELGKVVGAFPLYDGLFAGMAHAVAGGEDWRHKDIVEPDEETALFIKNLREKEKHTEDEIDFLEYFELMERITTLIKEKLA